MRLDFGLARIANGWYECKNWQRAIARSFYIGGRGINLYPRPKNPLVIWPGIIFLACRRQKACIGIQRTAIRPIMRRRSWSRGWKTITPGWESIGPTAAIL